jgi:hypothetical protein
VSRQGGVVIHAPRDWTVKTVQKAAALARHAGRMRSTDSASSSRWSTGYAPDAVHPTKKEDACGDVQAQRAACRWSLLKASLRALRGVSKTPLPGSMGFLPCLRNVQQLTAFEQAEMILYAA